MNSKRVFFLMLGIIILLFAGLFGGAYGVNSLFQQKAKQLDAMKAQSVSLSAQQQGLASAKKQVAKYASLEKIAKSIVPQDKDQAAAVREIATVAAASGIKQLSSVTFPASNLGLAIAAPTTNTSNTSASTTPSAAPTASSKTGLTQLTPVPGLTGVYQLPITITQTSDTPVTYNQFYDFLSRLEQNRRTAQVAAVTLQPDPNNAKNVAFTLVINEFIKP